MTKRILLACVLGLVLAWAACAQEDAAAEGSTEKPSAVKGDDKALQNLEEARTALLYGIDSTVLGVITQSTQRKDKRLRDEIFSLIQAPNAKVVTAVLDYAAAIEDWAPAVPTCSAIIVNYQDYDDKLVVRSLKFLFEAKQPVDTTLAKAIEDLARLTTKERQSAAIEAMGRLDFPDALRILRDLYTGREVANPQKKAVIEAIGRKKDAGQLEFLRSIYEDTGVDPELRRAAIGAIGALADPTILPVIRKAIVSSDLFERAAAIGALAGFPIESVSDLYRQALRDQAWRNRVNALGQLEKQGNGSWTPFLLYLVRSDPDKPVRQAAMRTLVKLDAGWKEFNDWLADAKIGTDIKVLVLSEACREHSGKINQGIRSLIDAEWKVPDSKLLESLAREMANAKTMDSDIYARLLEHKKESIRLYAIQGIRNNKLGTLRGKLEALGKESAGTPVKKAVDQALEDL